MNFNNEATYKYDNKEVGFRYIEKPSLQQKMAIIDGTVEGVINEDTGYSPILFKYFFAVSMIENLTDIELPKTFSESSEFIDEIEIGKILKDLIDPEDYTDIIIAINDKIEFEKKKMANRSSLDEFLSALTALINKYAEKFDGVDVKDVIEKLSSISKLAEIPEEELVRNILKVEENKKVSE